MREWRGVALSTLWSIYALIFLEWLFFVTKPSFMSILNWPRKFVILAVAVLPFLAIGLALVALFGLIARLYKEQRFRRLLWMEAVLVPTLVLGSLLVLLLDNFTNTVFGFGIQGTASPWNWFYALVLVVLYVGGFLLARNLSRRFERNGRLWSGFGGSLLLLSLLCFGFLALQSQRSDAGASSRLYASLERQPNILLISGDGLNAKNMSCYGYERDTTPFLQAVAARSALCENSFSNSSHTGASIASLLTGRLPTQTRVVYPPDILLGADSYRHLPGLLKKLGYRTMHMSARHYADAYDLNLRDGFDVSTYRKRAQVQTSQRLHALLGQESSYFVEQVVERVRGRIRHVFGISKLPHAFDEVAGIPPTMVGEPELADEHRIQALLDFVDESPEPFFAHVHLMGTHGSRSFPQQAVYSKDKAQDDHWMTDFYDDAILEFDRLMSEVFTALEQRQALSNTLIVLHSDHASKFDSRDRTPLIFVFPELSESRRIRTNAQNLDIAPTILDYLGVTPPSWMEGQSLLAASPRPHRPIFSVRCNVSAITKDYGHRQFDPTKAGPPFFSMGRTTMVICNRSYTIDWVKGEMVVHDIDGHTMPCPEAELPALEEAERLILEHLSSAGYDVSSVQRPLPIRFLEEL